MHRAYTVIKGLTFINSPVTSESSILNASSTPIDHLQIKEMTVDVQTHNFFLHLHGPPHKPKKEFWDCQLQILPRTSINLTRMFFEHRSPQPWHTFFRSLQKQCCFQDPVGANFDATRRPAEDGGVSWDFHFLFCRILYQVWVQQKHVLWCPSSNGYGYTNQKPHIPRCSIDLYQK